MPTAVVQIPAYEEGRTVYETATELVETQDLPDGWDVDYEAWVTLSPPDRELCDTWQNAMAAENVDVFEAPQGKLSARNAAHNSAVERGYDAIVTWDADAPPLTKESLGWLIQPLGRDGVAATDSRPRSRTEESFADSTIDLLAAIEDRVFPHIHGQAHGMTAEAWRQAGPFNTDLDQTSLADVRAEEEFKFRHRLSEVGEIVRPEAAIVYNDPRRAYCNMPFVSSDHCTGRVGTFEKSENRNRRGGCR